MSLSRLRCIRRCVRQGVEKLKICGWDQSMEVYGNDTSMWYNDDRVFMTSELYVAQGDIYIYLGRVEYHSDKLTFVIYTGSDIYYRCEETNVCYIWKNNLLVSIDDVSHWSGCDTEKYTGPQYQR
jgi:hypothetical protein